MAATRKPDRAGPKAVSPTGVPADTDGGLARTQAGSVLTTAQGLRLPDTDHSLKAGARLPHSRRW